MNNNYTYTYYDKKRLYLDKCIIKLLYWIFLTFILFLFIEHTMAQHKPLYQHSLNIKTVSEFLEQGHDINERDENGHTLLHIATYRGDRNLVAFLIEHEANINAVDRTEWTPLHVATYRGYQNIVNLLIEHKADINKPDRIGQTPLHIAIYRNNREIVDVFLRRGANRNTIDDTSWTPLHLAAYKGYEDIVSTLIRYKANVNSRDRRGWTPLSIASDMGYKNLISLLKTQGATHSESEEINSYTKDIPQNSSHNRYHELRETTAFMENYIGKEETKRRKNHNLQPFSNTQSSELQRIIAFIEEYINKEEIRTRLMQDPQTLSERQIQALRKVMPFIDGYMEVEADKGTDGTTTWIPLHWLLFAKNAEQILPVIEGYGDEASLMAKHDNYRTSFHWAFYKDRQKFTAFFKGEDINPSECPDAISN